MRTPNHWDDAPWRRPTSRRRGRLARALTIAVAATALLAACGSDDDSDESEEGGSATTAASAATTSAATGAPATTTAATSTTEGDGTETTTAGTVASTAPKPTAPVSIEPLALESTSVKVGITPGASSQAPLWIAQAEGYFADEGLEVELVTIETAAQHLAALSGGSIDVDLSTPEGVYAAINGGAPFKIIASLGQPNVFQWVISGSYAESKGITADSDPLDIIKALEGANIGTTPRGGGIYNSIVASLLTAELDPAQDAQLVELGGGSAMVGAIEQGAIDAFVHVPPITTTGADRSQGFTINVNALSDARPEFKTQFNYAILTTNGFLEDNPNTLTALTRAVVRAEQFAVNDTEKAFEDLLAAAPTSDRASFDVVVANFAPNDPVPSEEAHQSVSTLMNLARDPATPEVTLAYEDAIDPSIAEQVKTLLNLV